MRYLSYSVYIEFSSCVLEHSNKKIHKNLPIVFLSYNTKIQMSIK